MLEKLAKSIEEVNVLAEHYRTCQNVAAIESLAKEAAKAAMEMAAGREIETNDEINDGEYDVPFLKLTPVSVTADNMNEVIIDSGFHLREDVYLNRPDLLVN